MNTQPSSSTIDAQRARRPGLRRVGGVRRQRGAVAMLAAIFLIVAVAALGAIDIGNTYFVRRQLQRTADLAAMAAVQMISMPGGCSGAGSTATSNAQANGFTVDTSPAQTKTLTTTCGRWNTSSSPNFSQTGSTAQRGAGKGAAGGAAFLLSRGADSFGDGHRIRDQHRQVFARHRSRDYQHAAVSAAEPDSERSAEFDGRA